MIKPAAAAICLGLLLCSCASSDDGDRSVNLMVDRSALPAAGERGWSYDRTWSADLDGDGDRERVVLLAQVERRGESFLWEDGHRWVVYVEEPSGSDRRTYIYSRLVPMGRVELFVTAAEADRAPRLLILERSGSAVGLWEVRYRGRGSVDVNTLAEHTVDPATYVGGAVDR